MLSRPSVLVLLAAACSGEQAKQGTTTTPAEVVAVPLTASSAALVLAQPQHEDLVPPWSLTASDGSGLVLTRVDAKAVFEGPLAFTELHLYFRNGEGRVREGTFQITLPQRAAVSRFAMENNGQWMEAEVVEKQLARRAYDDFLHRRQDPALLEKAAGNQFTAKVFPIAPNSDKHLVISYSQELPGAQYTLPLRGLPKTERVDVALSIMGADGKRVEQKLAEKNWQPDRDFMSTVTGSAAAVLAGNAIAAQVEIGAGATADTPKSMTLLVDTSASRALGYARYIGTLRQLVDGIEAKYGAGLGLQIIAFDQDVESIFAGRASDFGDAHTKKLLERGAAGASDLGQALAWLAKQQPHQRVVVVTDGVITAGAEGAELQKRVGELAAAKVERVDFLLAGGLRDEQAMSALVRSGLPRAGAVLDLDRDPVVAALGESVKLDVAIEIPGASWIYPRTISSARAGTRAMVYARMPKQQSIEIKVGGQVQKMAPIAGTGPLVERALASAEIEDLEAKLAKATHAEDATTLRATIAKKSVAARVISSQTSLLVLESDADYATYGIDRRALADVLVVGPNGIERKGRPAPAQLAQPDVRTATKPKADSTDPWTERGDLAKAKQEEAKKESVRRDDSPTFEHDGVEGGVAGGVVGGVVGGEASGYGMGQGQRPEPPRPTTATTSRPPPPPEPAPSPEPEAKPEAIAAAQSSSDRRQAEAQLQRLQREQAGLQRAERRRNSLPGDVAVRHRRVLESTERARGVRISNDCMNNALCDEESSGGAAGGVEERWPPKDAPPALTGELADITKLMKRDLNKALDKARDWHAREPGNVLALIALGETLEAKGSKVTAARVYGSIIDLFPGRVDMRRFAGERLARLHAHAQELIIDTYRRAVADRPDHMTGHRLYAYALVRAGRHASAFAAILAGVDQQYRNTSFAGGERVLGDDAAMIGAAYAAAVPAKRKEIEQELGKRSLALATKPSTRFILYWETDANDVDFHIQDARGGHAFYSNPKLASGGELYADVTTGYGPECFAIQGTPKAGPYRVSINYYSQGPMGYGMGLLSIQRFDGKGGMTFEDRPYVIMNDHAYVDLGTVR